MDALSDVLRIVGLAGGVFMDAEFTAPWSVAGKVAPELCAPFMPDPQQIMGFHYVVEGRLELRIEGQPTVTISAGQAVLLPGNDLHVFGSSGGLPTIPVSSLVPQSVDSGMAKFVHGGGGARTHVVCGFLGGNEQLHPLLAGLPPVMKIDLAPLPSGDWIGRTFSFAAQMVSDADPGSATVLAKVSELLFVEAVRRYLAALPPEQTGWLAGLRDPAVGKALSLLHARVSENWTAEALAQEVPACRAPPSRTGSPGLVGQPPMRYLTYGTGGCSSPATNWPPRPGQSPRSPTRSATSPRRPSPGPSTANAARRRPPGAGSTLSDEDYCREIGAGGGIRTLDT